MEKVTWNDNQCSVGHDTLDSQHKQLLEVINHAISLNNNNHTRSDVYRVLLEIHEHFEQHFISEELVLERAGYPHLEDHIQYHENFSDKFSRMMVAGTPDVHKILHYLLDWLNHHMLEEDMEYKPLFSEAG